MSMLLTEAPTEDPDVYRMTVEQLELMDDAGVFPPEARVELINGVLVNMSPIGEGHHYVVLALTHLLVPRLDGRAVVSVQGPLLLSESWLPQPDLYVVRGPRNRYHRGRRPSAQDALLVVEVADSSLRYDHKVKLPRYASSGVPEAWVVDVRHRRVHVYTDPEDGGYATTATCTSGDTLVVSAFPDVEVPVSDLGLDELD